MPLAETIREIARRERVWVIHKGRLLEPAA